MTRVYFSSGLIVSLIACSPSEPGSTANATQAESTYYAAKAGSAEFPTPDTGSDGRFGIESGCLVFVSAEGRVYLPVFPADTRFARVPGAGPIAILKGSEIHIGRVYTVKGGKSEYRVNPDPPDTCPTDQFLVGGLL